MPVMDGYALCRAWRQDPRLALVPFVFYTATYTEPRDEQFGLSLGADRFLIKPMAIEDLLEVVLDLLARGPRAPAAVPADEPAYLQEYNMALFRKLERKMAANARLEEEVRHFQNVESLGRMAGNIAHDLNNLLAPILSMAGLLLEGYGDHPELHKRLATILVAAEQARSLVQGLTEFARKDVPAFEPVDLNALVHQAVDLLEADVRPGIRWDLLLEAGLPRFPGAPMALSRVLLNLGRNAVDATQPPGSVRIATRTLDPGRVELTVADTGHGIPAELLAKVTEPFFTTKGRGTGLGLAIVQNIVRAHAGTLAVESQVGQGTCIRVILPVR
jgi:signal transduction histidine kinase